MQAKRLLVQMSFRDEAVDTVRHASGHEHQESRKVLTGHDQPHGERHKQNSKEGDQIGNGQRLNLDRQHGQCGYKGRSTQVPPTTDKSNPA